MCIVFCPASWYRDMTTHLVQHPTAVLYFFPNLEVLILPKIEMNHRNGEYKEAAVRLCLEHKLTGGASSVCRWPKLIRWKLQWVCCETAERLQVCTSGSCLTRSHIPCGVIIKQSPPEWRGIITRVAALAGKFSHFQVSITLICLHKLENFDSHSFACVFYVVNRGGWPSGSRAWHQAVWCGGDAPGLYSLGCRFESRQRHCVSWLTLWQFRQFLWLRAELPRLRFATTLRTAPSSTQRRVLDLLGALPQWVQQPEREAEHSVHL